MMAVRDSGPTHIIHLLETAAANGSDKGNIYLDGGWAAPPTRQSYAQLYRQALENAIRLQNTGIVKRGKVVITYFESHPENVLWFWSVTAAGGICAVLNPVSNEAKTATGQLENLKTLFGNAPVLTSHKLSAIFASRGLSVKTVEQVIAAPVVPKPEATLANGTSQTNGIAKANGHAHTNGAVTANGDAHTNGHAHTNGKPLANGHAHTNGDTHMNGTAPTNGEAPVNGRPRSNQRRFSSFRRATSGGSRLSLGWFDGVFRRTSGQPNGEVPLANSQSSALDPAPLTNGQVNAADESPAVNGLATNGDDVTQTNPDDIAAILFTSGSTGHSKAVKFSHAQLIASVVAKSEYMSTRGMTFMSWISFDHSACFCEVHLQALYNGDDQVFVPTSEFVMEPQRFFNVLSLYQVGYTFSPNFFLAASASALERQTGTSEDIDLSKLSVIMCGGEANRTKTLEATDKILRKYGAPAHSIKAAYGLSETCSACFYNLESPEYDVDAGNTFASVGKPLPGGLEMKIVSRGEEEDRAGQGIIYVRGDVIFQGYYNNETATKGCMTDDGWMNTGDIGTLDKNGNLQLLGRAKEILILNGNNYSSFEIEYALETANIAGLTTSFTAVFSTWDQARDSEAVVVLFNPTEAAIGPKNMRATIQAIDKTIFNVCAQRALHIIPLPKALLPKSTIGKLSRAKLKQGFEGGAFEDYIIDDKVAIRGANAPIDAAQPTLEQLSPLQQEIAKIYSSIVNVPPEELLGGDALLSSGINSLGFMRLKKALEKGLKIHQEIPMPLLLRCHSIADLEHELVLLGTVSQQYEPIIPLSTTGSKQPLFLLHPGSGEFLCWVGLLKFLDDRPVYALRAKGLHPGEGTFNGLEEVLTSYHAAIRRVQPKGPYAMLGYCFGGLLCFELAKMFEAAGDTVNFCGGIDNPPSLKRTIGQVQYRTLMIDILPVVTEMTETEARAFGEETAGLTDEQFYEVLFTKFSPEFIENMDITVPRLQAFGRVEDSMRLIADKYVPEGTVATSDIFCADPMPHFGATPEVWKKDVLGEWKTYVKGANVTFHNVEGTHISLIKEPQLPDFARRVNAALAQRGV